MYPNHPSHAPGQLHPFDPTNCQWDAIGEQQRRQNEAFAYLAWRDAQEARAGSDAHSRVRGSTPAHDIHLLLVL